MKKGALCAVIESQIYTQLLFCIKENKLVKLEKYFAVHDFPQNTQKIGRRKIFPFYGMSISLYFLPLPVKKFMCVCRASRP